MHIYIFLTYTVNDLVNPVSQKETREIGINLPNDFPTFLANWAMEKARWEKKRQTLEKKCKALEYKCRTLQKALADKLRSPKQMNPMAAELFENEKRNEGKRPKQRRYSNKMKLFALEHSFYSNAGYNNLKKVFYLPNIRSIRRDLEGIECDPGILYQVLEHCKQEIAAGNRTADCVAIIDEMAICKKLLYDPGTKRVIGFTTIVDKDGKITSGKTEAKSVLVFFLVGLDGTWRFPVAYFFTDSFTGVELDCIVKLVLRKTSESGLKIRGMVFDGLGANVTFANEVGVNIGTVAQKTGQSSKTISFILKQR